MKINNPKNVTINFSFSCRSNYTYPGIVGLISADILQHPKTLVQRNEIKSVIQI